MTEKQYSLGALDSGSEDSQPVRGPRFPRAMAALVRNFLQGIGPWTRYCQNPPLCILVLGMHRSGTSCIARMIHLCGASLGTDIAGANWSNQAGHWEALEGIAINEGLLRYSGGSWDTPPSEIVSDARLRWKMRGFLGRLHVEGTCVWKDPRNVATFQAWRPLLKNYLPVAVFRSPVSVSLSLQRREGWSLDRGMALWREYNSRLLHICADDSRVIWIDFDCGLEHMLNRIEDVANTAGLAMNEAVGASYARTLRTSDRQVVSLDPVTSGLYEALREKAGSARE